MLEFGEKGGFFVKSITTDDIQELRELREVLELGALRLLLIVFCQSLSFWIRAANV
jgi:DNA-binding GntR family transcriptional regulator